MSQKKKINRVSALKNANINKLEGMKERKATRFVLTKVRPDLTEEDVEYYILDNFEDNDVYVRKKQDDCKEVLKVNKFYDTAMLYKRQIILDVCGHNLR